jgi:predicted nucleic acid-binding protein
MKRVLLDTNIYIDWMNTGEREDLVIGSGLLRHMSSVVLMELEAGATTLAARHAVNELSRVYEKAGRLVLPTRAVWKRAGGVLRGLRSRGREIRRSSLVHDVWIALTARDIGASVITNDASDFSEIRKLVDFSLSIV